MTVFYTAFYFTKKLFTCLIILSCTNMKNYLLLLFAILLLPLFSSGRSTNYLNEIPDPNEVINSITGVDSVDTKAKQLGALDQIMEFMYVMSDFNSDFEPLPAEKAVKSKYIELSIAIHKEMDPLFPNNDGNPSSYGKWLSLSQGYKYNKQLTEDLLNRFFSNEWASTYRSKVSQQKIERVENYRAESLAREERNAHAFDKPQSKELDDMVQTVQRSILIYEIIFALCLLWFVYEIIVFLRPIYRKSDFPTIVTSRGVYTIYWFRGTVLSPTKSKLVTTYRTYSHYDTNGNYVPGSSSTSVDFFDQFFIRSSDGSEMSVQLQNWNIAVRESHDIAAVWAIKRKRKTGPYVYFQNFTTKEILSAPKIISHIFKPRKRIWIPLALLTIPVAYFLMISGLLSTFTKTNQINYLAFAGGMITLLFGLFLIWYLITRVIAGSRVRKFMRSVSFEGNQLVMKAV